MNTLFAITIFELDIILIFIFWQEVADNEILQVMLLVPTTLLSDKSSWRYEVSAFLVKIVSITQTSPLLVYIFSKRLLKLIVPIL